MAVYKNVSGQKIAIFAYDSTTGDEKTGDAANITAQISLNGGTTAATNDVNPTELDATDAPGIYIFDLTQAETNADLIVVSAVSSTADVEIDPVIIYTTPGTNTGVLSLLAPVTHTSAVIPTVDTLTNKTGFSLTAGTGLGNQTANITGNLSGSVGSVTGAVGSVTGNVGGNVVGSVGSVTARVTANTDQWNGVGVTGMPMPTYTQPTGFLAANFGNLDAAVSSRMATFSLPTNFAALGINASGHVSRVTLVDTTTTNTDMISAAGIRTAVGLASANLDTQLGDIPTVAEFNARTIPSADYFVVADYTAPPSAATIADAVWDESQSGHTTLGTFGYYLDARVSAVSGGGLTVQDIVDGVLDELLSGHTIPGSVGAGISAAGSAGDPWSTILPASYTGLQAGKILKDIFDKAILIVAGEVQFAAMVNPNGEIDNDIVIGSDYLAANGRAFKWTVTAPAGYVVGTSTCKFGGRHVRDSVSSSWEVTGTVTDNGDGTWDLSHDMTKTISGALTEGMHHWSVDLISAGGTEITPVKSGKLVKVVAKQTT